MPSHRSTWLPSLSVLLGLALVAAVGTGAYRQTASRDEMARSVSHTHSVLGTLDGLLLHLDDAVSARRGYALSGELSQLGPYRVSVERVGQSRVALRNLTRDNPAQQRRLDALEPLLAARLQQLENNLRPSPGLEARVTEEGNAQSAAVRDLVAEMAREEQRLLAEREETEAAESLAVRRRLFAGFGLSLALLLLAFVLLAREASRRRRTEDALESKEQETSLTLESIGDGVLATDAGGRVVRMNPVAEQLTGWPAAEALGRPFTEVFRILHEQTRTPQPDPVAEVLSSGAPVALANHTVLVARDGTERPIADSAAPMLDADGRVQGAVLVFRDVTATRASEVRFRRLLEAAPDAILLTDSHGHITMANPQVQALFGYAPEALVGQPIEVLIPERVRHQHEEHRGRYAAAPGVRAMGAGLPLFARRQDGSEFPVEISLSPLQGTDGPSVIAAVRDVSRRHALEQFREEYLEFISHDLKNPLSVISLQAGLLSRQLARRQLPEEARGVAIIAESAAFIDRLVRELLEMAYVESERLELHLEALPLGPFLEAVLERTISSVDRRRVRLEVVEPATALVEPRRIERVVVNFLQNALKYSPPGSPITLRLEKAEGQARVSVIDVGPGLSAEDGSFVFEKYRRTLGAQHKEGLGLGLFISRKIVDAHGGHIGVRSVPGAGATFFFSVPLAPERAEVAVHGQAAGPRLSGLRVLLVDDEANAVAALAALLGEEGLRISGATSGAQALEMANAQPFDVAVLDVQMPGMSGLELLRRLRERHPQLPAVIMTGYMAHHPEIAELRGATGAAFVGKPVDPDELVRTLQRLVPGGAR